MENDPINAFLPFISLFLVYIFPIIINRRLAIKKGRSKVGWIIAVFFLSWWSTLILACLRSKLTLLEQTTLQSKDLLKTDLEKFKS